MQLRITKNSARGFTLLEVMITLIIVIIISTVGFVSMSGYLPKQRLLATARFMENVLLRAQSEAYSRSERVGVHFFQNGSEIVGEIFLDNFAAGTDFQQDAAQEPPLTGMKFRRDIQFIPSSNCDAVMESVGGRCDFGGAPAIGCYVFFNNTGEAIVNVGGVDTLSDYSLFIYNPNLVVGATAAAAGREIEVLSSGLVQVLKQGQLGDANPAQAATTCAVP